MIEILKEGKHYLVINKPANTVVVTGRGVPKPTLLDLLQEKFNKNIKPVHRLDRVTTGCLIFAKDVYGQQALSNAFRKRLVKKTYLALVEGVPEFKKISVDKRLKKIKTPENKKSQAHQIISHDSDGDRALTHFKILKVLDNNKTLKTLIEARPITGRMHQIRIHLSSLGFPIVGDKLYGSKLDYKPHQIALHAYSIEFPAPSGEWVKVESPCQL